MLSNTSKALRVSSISLSINNHFVHRSPLDAARKLLAQRGVADGGR